MLLRGQACLRRAAPREDVVEVNSRMLLVFVASLMVHAAASAGGAADGTRAPQPASDGRGAWAMSQLEQWVPAALEVRFGPRMACI